MNFIKKHCFLFVTLIILIAIIIAGFIVCKNLFFSNNGDVFGNRLDGIEEHPIKDETLNLIKEELEALEQVNSVSNNIVGRRADFIIEVKSDVDVVTSQGLGEIILGHLDDVVKGYYDVQVMITNEDAENQNYPIIGYKHKSRNGFSW